MKKVVPALTAIFQVSICAALIHVPGDYATLQDAWNHAGGNDTIRVASGTYSGTGWTGLYFTGKNVTIEGDPSGSRPVIDGQGSRNAWTFSDGSTAGCTVRNFIFRDCVEDLVGTLHILQNANITISNCDIIRGAASGLSGDGEGGGIRIWYASPIIDNCRIDDCSADQGGGINVLSNSHPVIRNTTISNCQGCGILISTNCNPVIEDSYIYNNTASSISWSGGISCLDHSDATIERCIFEQNHNSHSGGGGLRVEKSSPQIINCFFIDNDTSVLGGGILCRDNATPAIRFCTIAGNSAGSNGDGIAALVNSTVTIFGSIVWQPAGSDLHSETGSVYNVTYTDSSTVMSGTGNFSADPLFAGGSDYHLTASSPCIDAVPIQCEPLDIDGDSRTSPCDAGADEYGQAVQLAVAIHMPANNFWPTDPFSLAVSTQNGGGYLYNLQMIVGLEVGGQFWFYPSWTSFDSVLTDVKPGYSEYGIIPEFNWPPGAGSYSGAHFYAGFTDSSITVLIGNLAVEAFGWSM